MKQGFAFLQEEFGNSIPVGTIEIEGVSARVSKKRILDRQGLENDTRDSYDVQLGPLTLEQFLALKGRFKSTSSLSYQADQIYELTDFLPPFVQRVNQCRFLSLDTVDPEVLSAINQSGRFSNLASAGQTSLVANCWNTALEFLKGSQEGMDIYYAPSQVVSKIFEDQDYFATVSRPELEFGDLIYYHQKHKSTGENLAVHVAVYIAEGLFFEKSGAQQKYFYRLVPESVIHSTYGHFATYLRHTGKPLPGPDFFTLERTDTFGVYSNFPPSVLRNYSGEPQIDPRFGYIFFRRAHQPF
jgi:hypothetical protein